MVIIGLWLGLGLAGIHSFSAKRPVRHSEPFSLPLALTSVFCYNFLMSSLHTPPAESPVSRVLLAVGLLAVTTVGISLALKNGSLDAYILRHKAAPVPWFALDAQDVGSGATIPADTNVVFHLPENFTTISRQILLGQSGKTVRYWGYCFAQNYDPTVVNSRTGFPGQMFFSEKEQAERAAAAAENAPQFSLQNLPTKSELERLQQRQVSNFRNQIAIFKPNMLCYIMSEAPLAIGLDPDNDKLNDRVEQSLRTASFNPDTDGDGISDGTEYLTHTDPLLRDTDGDGIIDGIEDKNWDGNINSGETDPRNKDTDRDGLCDGMCRIRLSNNQQLYAGEDKNLNGIVDKNESDPLLPDSLHDGYGDYQRFTKCILQGSSEC